MNEILEREIGHWLDKIDDKYCQNVDQYEIADIRETARYFYNFALKEMKAIINDRYDDNLNAYEKITAPNDCAESVEDVLDEATETTYERGGAATLFSAAAKEDYDIMAIIEEKQGLNDDDK